MLQKGGDVLPERLPFLAGCFPGFHPPVSHLPVSVMYKEICDYRRLHLSLMDLRLTSDTSKFRLDHTGVLVETFQIPGELECGSGNK